MKNSKKLLNILITATLAATLTQFTSKLDAKIPEYTGLYTLFTKDGDSKPAVDTIGIGQSLKYSNWLENVYTYAPEDNAAKKVIQILWNKRLFEGPEDAPVFTENNNFVISSVHPAKNITPQNLGKIIKYIRDTQANGQSKDLESLCKSIKSSGTREKEQTKNLIIALTELKNATNSFIPEIAESILWAFFESNTNWGEQEFKACLNEIDPSYCGKLSNQDPQATYCAIGEKHIENIATKLIENPDSTSNLVDYDRLTSYLIKTERSKSIPTKVLQANLKCKHPKTGVESKQSFPTCFESSILDILSILCYDQQNLQYNPNILPEEIKNGETFKNLIEQVFKFYPESTTFSKNAELTENGQTEAGALPEENAYYEENINYKDKEFILSENINKSMQTWINIISNLPELKYKNENSYDLNPSFENLVKVLNKFLDLGFEITDTKDTLKVNYNNNGTVKKITVQKDKTESWQTLFDTISKKLSTQKRLVKFTVKKNVINNTGDTPFCTGEIKIFIGYTNLDIIINAGHAYIVCTERDKSKLAASAVALQHAVNTCIKNTLIKNISTNNSLIPLFMFLPYVQIIENNQQTENLLYYSFDLKDHNTKKEFLTNFFASNIAENSPCTLLLKLIDLLPENDKNFILPLSKYLDKLSESPAKKSNAELSLQNGIESKIVKFIKTINYDPKYKDSYLLGIIQFLSGENKNDFLTKKLKEVIEYSAITNNSGETALHVALIFNKTTIICESGN